MGELLKCCWKLNWDLSSESIVWKIERFQASQIPQLRRNQTTKLIGLQEAEEELFFALHIFNWEDAIMQTQSV